MLKRSPTAVWFLALLVFGFAFLVRLDGIKVRELHEDETRQANTAAAGPFDRGIVDKAASARQPPLDYYVEAIFLKHLPHNSKTYRLHSAVFGSLIAVGFMLLLHFLTGSLGFGFVWGLILATSPKFVIYAQYSRPVSIGMFLGLTYVLLLLRYLQSSAAPHSFRWVINLVMLQVLMLTATGFQPAIFLAASAVACLPMLVSATLRWRVLMTYLWSGIALAMSWPVIRNTFGTSGGSSFDGSFGLTQLSGLWDALLHLTFSGFLHYFKVGSKFVFENPAYYVIFSATICIMALFHKQISEKLKWQIGYVSLFCFAYPVIHWTIFWGIVNYNRFYERYYFNFAPMAFAFWALACYLAYRLSQLHGAMHHRRKIIGAAVAAAALLMFHEATSRVNVPYNAFDTAGRAYRQAKFHGIKQLAPWLARGHVNPRVTEVRDKGS